MLKLLVVEDNKILSDNIAKYLELEGMETTQLFSGEKVSFELASTDYDLVILDLWLWEYDGIDICKHIRESGKNIPILILTARTSITDKKQGFSSWADDYLTKPFDYEELLLRIQALIRRNFTVKSNIISLWNIEVDTDNKTVKNDWENIHLSHLEFDLLLYLLHNKSKVITKIELLEKVWWEYDDFNMSRTVDVYVWYLRKKLWKDIIVTIRGQWYMIK